MPPDLVETGDINNSHIPLDVRTYKASEGLGGGCDHHACSQWADGLLSWWVQRQCQVWSINHPEDIVSDQEEDVNEEKETTVTEPANDSATQMTWIQQVSYA